ncbi:MAG: hypothetical protein DI534_06085 [Leifsonia xyli]|nr:MAG: hypothetical protein DI534_06085 [Leifsonia xyli]
MTILAPTTALGAAVHVELLARTAFERLADTLAAPGRAMQRARADARVRNEIAPLILIAVIAVAAALALVALIGAAAAWLFYCQSQFGRNYWPAVNWPGQKGGLFYLACARV